MVNLRLAHLAECYGLFTKIVTKRKRTNPAIPHDLWGVHGPTSYDDNIRKRNSAPGPDEGIEWWKQTLALTCVQVAHHHIIDFFRVPAGLQLRHSCFRPQSESFLRHPV
jgi:hypothetical protein